MRAEKKLKNCSEVCKYNSYGICSFGLIDIWGCFLDEDVRIKAGAMLRDAMVINTMEMMRSLGKS